METAKRNPLTTGPVLKTLLAFSLPYLLSCFLQQLYGLADLFITGRYEGADVVTAVSVGSQFMHMVTAVIIGLAMGSTVIISQATGANDHKRRSLAVGNTASLFALASVALMVLLLVFKNSILDLMSVPPEAWQECGRYMQICFLGIPIITAYNIITCIYRGSGDSRTPMYFIAAACFTNIFLDYILIGRMGWKASGAAWATVIAQLLSVVLALAHLSRSGLVQGIRAADFRLKKEMCTSLLSIGVPIAAQDGFIQISFLIITAIGNSRGLVDAAAIGIVEKIISFFFLVPSALSQSLSAMAAQNVGAGKPQRALLCLKDAVALSFGYGLIVVLISNLAGSALIGCFIREAEVVKAGASYLSSYSFDALGVAVHFCMSSYFCAFGRSVPSFIQNLLSVLIFRIPIAYFASKWFPSSLFYMGLGAPAGSAFQALFCLVYYRWNRNFFLGTKADEKNPEAGLVY